MNMTNFQDVLRITCGTIILVCVMFCFVVTCIRKLSAPPNDKRIFREVCQPSRHTHSDPFRYHLVPLGYHHSTDTFNFRESESLFPTKIEGDEVQTLFSNELYRRRPRRQLVERVRLERLPLQFDDESHDEGRNPLEISRSSNAQENMKPKIFNSNRGLGADYSPFLAACWNCDITKITYTIALGADTSQKTKAGETGLMLVIYKMAKGMKPWNPICLNLLLENGCPINEVTNDDNSALHLAVKAGHFPAVKWLLDHGACVRITNKQGWRPMAIAQARRRTDILELLWENYDEKIEEGSGTGRNSSHHDAKTCPYCEKEDSFSMSNNE